MAQIRVNPTRMELKKLKNRLAVARRGHKLLKDKRDELMKQFLDAVRETKTVREKVEAALEKSNKSFALASAVTSPKVMTESFSFASLLKEFLLKYLKKRIKRFFLFWEIFFYAIILRRCHDIKRIVKDSPLTIFLKCNSTT